jgi:LDH2 family malate/lactate/ureidoglycolate dehydrogenase
VEEIFLPGELGQRTEDARLKEGIPIDDDVWAEIQTVAQELRVAI